MSSPDEFCLLTSSVGLNLGDAAIAAGSIHFLQLATGFSRVPILDLHAARTATMKPDGEYAPSWRRAAYVPAPSKGPLYRRAIGRLLGAQASVATRLAHRESAAVDLLMRDRQAETAQLIRNASLVASTGGTYLVDQYEWEDQLAEYEIVLRAGKPLVFLSQTMGPFGRTSAGYGRLRRVLDHASLVMLRDSTSEVNVRRLGVASRTIVAPDMAFLLARGTAAVGPASTTGHSTTGGDRPRIVVSVREWKHATPGSPAPAQQQFAARVPQLLERLVDEFDADVSMISTCQGIDGYCDDSDFASTLVEATRNSVRDRITVDRIARSPAEFIRCAGSFDLAICTRMHAGILSWIAGTPVIAIAYEQKTVDLFENRGTPDLVHDYGALEVDSIIDQSRAILDGRRESRAEIERWVAERADELRVIADEFSAFMGGR